MSQKCVKLRIASSPINIDHQWVTFRCLPDDKSYFEAAPIEVKISIPDIKNNLGQFIDLDYEAEKRKVELRKYVNKQ